MTRFVVDAGVVLHRAGTQISIAGRHKLLAPTLLRSRTLSLLHQAVQRAEISSGAALDQLALIAKTPIRLLGDAFVTLDTSP